MGNFFRLCDSLHEVVDLVIPDRIGSLSCFGIKRQPSVGPNHICESSLMTLCVLGANRDLTVI